MKHTHSLPNSFISMRCASLLSLLVLFFVSGTLSLMLSLRPLIVINMLEAMRSNMAQMAKWFEARPEALCWALG